MDTLIRLISAIFKNIFKVIGFLILIGGLIYFIYFLVGYFSLPNEKIKSYTQDSFIGKLELKTSFRTFEDAYLDSIIGKKGNIYAQILFTPKDSFSKNKFPKNDITEILFIFKDKDGFELFRTNIPYRKISTNDTDFNGKLVKENGEWDKERFSFEIYNKIDSFDYFVFTDMSENKDK